MSKNLLHQFIASLLILTLGYVQVVLVQHQSHSTSITAQESDSDTHPDVPKCDICDYHSNKRHLNALLVSQTVLVIFELKGETIAINKETFLLSSHHHKLSNRGPPSV